MFGYIIPAAQELKVREFDLFKSCYCGLCHTLGKRYGLVSRFFLNYDFVFLAMLLWQGEDELKTSDKRCIACPYKKKKCVESSKPLEDAAGMSVILSWWKIQDTISDDMGFKKAAARVIGVFLKHAYKKAKADYSAFDEKCASYLKELTVLEKSNCDSLDKTADCFANILKSAAKSDNSDTLRIQETILYHIGRWIYIIDAYDDLEKDRLSGDYNPVAIRFGTYELSDEDKERIKTTLLHSRNIAGASLELMETTPFTDILRNIIYFGMPSVASAVEKHEFRKQKFKHKR